MTGKEFSQRPFTFPRGTKVRIRYTSIGKNHRDNIKEAVCCFYGIKPIFSPCSANAEDFAPVFRAVAKNGKMSNKRPEFDGIHCQLFSTIISIDYADVDDNWCRDCEQHAHFCFLSEFEEKMDGWLL